MANLFAFSYNGVHVGQPRFSVQVNRSQFTRAAAGVLDLQTSAQGRAFSARRLREPREIVRNCCLRCDDPTDLRAKFLALNQLLHYDDAEHRLVLDDDPGKFYNAIVQGGIIDEPYRSKSSFELRFLCADPYGYSETQSDVSQTISASPSTVVFPSGSGSITGATNATPIVITSTAHGLSTGHTVVNASIGGNTNANGRFVITVVDADHFSLDDSEGNANYTSGGTWTRAVGGSAKAEPEWYIRNNTGGTVTTDVTLENVSLPGDTLTLNLSWPTGYWVKVGSRDTLDRYRTTVKLSTASGSDPLLLSFANALNGFKSGWIPRLLPGVQNSMRVTGLSSGTLRGIFRETYV